MAVTYSWRLDTNKYAYLLPPDELESGTSVPSEDENEYTEDDYLIYGYLSTTPLRDYFAKSVATKAEDLFGKDTTIDNPLGEYQKAFNIMLSKIKMADSEEGYTQIMGDEKITFVWEGISNYDLLSADEYFNVDAVSCVDLRGVGVKEIKYIGSIPGSFYSEGGIEEITSPVDDNDNIKGIVLKGATVTVDYVNSNGNEELKNITVRQGIPGFSDVYGIYMDDHTNKDGEIEETTVPENFFIVKNGKIGMRGEQGKQGDKGDDGQNASESIENLREDVGKLQKQVSTIINVLNKIIGEGYENYEDWTNPVSDLSNDIDNIETEIERLNNKVLALEENNITPDIPIAGGGSVEIYQQKHNDKAGSIPITQDLSNYGPYNGDDDYKIGNDTTIYLLGYYPKYNGKDGVDEASRLFAIPNIAVSKEGLKIMGKIDAEEMYANKGFFKSQSNLYDSITVFPEDNK